MANLLTVFALGIFYRYLGIVACLMETKNNHFQSEDRICKYISLTSLVSDPTLAKWGFSITIWKEPENRGVKTIHFFSCEKQYHSWLNKVYAGGEGRGRGSMCLCCNMTPYSSDGTHHHHNHSLSVCWNKLIISLTAQVLIPICKHLSWALVSQFLKIAMNYIFLSF